MKQVVQNYRTGELKVDDFPHPTVRSNGVLVINRFSLISAGTEKSTINVAKKNLVGKAMERPDMVRKVVSKIQKDGLVDTMKMVFARLDAPVGLGYSCAGIISEAGGNANEFSVNDRVACAGQNYASHADTIYVPKNLCVKIPEGVTFEDAAYVTLGAIALQGVRQADPKLGETVAVIGLGLLGQITVQMLKASGCIVIASDLDPKKQELARSFGVEEAVSPEDLELASANGTQGQGVDSVIITASTTDNGPIRTAGEICRRKGRVIVVGAVGMTLPREPYYLKELDLRLSTSYGPGRYDPQYEEKGHDYPYGYVRWTEKRNMQAFLSLIQQGKIDVKKLTSHTYKIGEAEQAYDLIMEGNEPYLGILLAYDAESRIEQQRRIELRESTQTERLNIGLIGAGNHVKDMLLPNLSKIKGVQLRTVCTNTGIKAKALAEKIGASYCTSDYREVLKDNSINAVLIGTHHNSHANIVIEALKADKHVFVEKPLCLTEVELDELTAVYVGCADQGLHLMVGFNRRYSSHGRKAKEFCEDRRNPLVMTYRVNAGSIPKDHWIQDPEIGGGRIIGEACHFVDYMQFVCGARPVSVSAQHIASHSSGVVDDQSILTFTFADGSIGTLIYAAGGDSALAKERFEVFGDGKSLTMDDFMITEMYSKGKKVKFKSNKRDKGFQNEMTEFSSIILDGSRPSITFDEIRAVTLACLLAAKSMQTGQSYQF